MLAVTWMNAHFNTTILTESQTHMLKQLTMMQLMRWSQWIYKEWCHPQLTKHQHECPCTILHKHNQQWYAPHASFHPYPNELHELHSNQNEQEALKNEAGGNSGNQM